MSDSEQCSNRLEFDLISLLVNFSCELGQIMTRYDFLWARWVILSNVWTDFDFGQLCMCIGVNNLGGSFEKSPNVVLTTIQNFIEIQSSRFWWCSFVFARTQSRLVVYCFTKFQLQRCIVYNYIVNVNWPCILRSEHIEYYLFPSTRLLIDMCVKTFLCTIQYLNIIIWISCDYTSVFKKSERLFPITEVRG